MDSLPSDENLTLEFLSVKIPKSIPEKNYMICDFFIDLIDLQLLNEWDNDQDHCNMKNFFF